MEYNNDAKNLNTPDSFANSTDPQNTTESNNNNPQVNGARTQNQENNIVTNNQYNQGFGSNVTPRENINKQDSQIDPHVSSFHLGETSSEATHKMDVDNDSNGPSLVQNKAINTDASFQPVTDPDGSIQMNEVISTPENNINPLLPKQQEPIVGDNKQKQDSGSNVPSSAHTENLTSKSVTPELGCEESTSTSKNGEIIDTDNIDVTIDESDTAKGDGIHNNPVLNLNDIEKKDIGMANQQITHSLTLVHSSVNDQYRETDLNMNVHTNEFSSNNCLCNCVS